MVLVFGGQYQEFRAQQPGRSAADAAQISAPDAGLSIPGLGQPPCESSHEPGSKLLRRGLHWDFMGFLSKSQLGT